MNTTVKKIKNNKYEGRLYIKDGKFMQRNSDGIFYEADISVTKIKKKLSEMVENIENIKHPNLNSLIMVAIKEVTKFNIVSHCKISSDNPKCKIKSDDPLYTDFVNYIQSLQPYQDYLTHNKKVRESINQRRSEGQKAKKAENDFFDFYMDNKQKRIKRYCR